uniref:AMP-binding protein n=1 Tax=Actinosynnema sp. TaxID=1872144 RepID=UPI003F847858
MPTPAVPPWSFRHHWMAHTATHAATRPDKPALRYLGQTTTWSQLSDRSLRLAAALAGRGVAAGDRVATLTLNHPWFVETVFGANSLGAMAVPLSFRLAPPELDYILADCTPSAVVVDARLLPLLSAVPAASRVGAVVVVGGALPEDAPENFVAYEDFLTSHEPLDPPDVPEDATALIMYT